MPDAHQLETVLSALANPTRRGVLEALRAGPKSVGELAQPHDMALPSFLQHVRTLEKSGLVVTEKQGRTRVVRSRREPLLLLEEWLDAERIAWERRLNQLDDFLTRGHTS